MKGPNANETVVFVGNIPYDQTEEQILDILSSAGPVVNFRLVLDKDNGRSKGYGFVQYHDPETASSAVRNLNNYPIDNRRLKVDFSHESTIMSTKPQKSGEPDETENLLAWLPPGVVPPPNLSTAQAISSALFFFSANEVLEILKAIKSLSVSDPALLRELFRTAPQLSYAIVQSLLLFGLRETSMVTDIVDPDYGGRSSSNARQSTPSGSNNRPSSRNDLFKPPIAAIPNIPQQIIPPAVAEAGPPLANPIGANSNQTLDQKAALLKQVASLSEDQIALFPPEQRNALLDLKGKIQRGEL